jgi:hypothetical protein
MGLIGSTCTAPPWRPSRCPPRAPCAWSCPPMRTPAKFPAACCPRGVLGPTGCRAQSDKISHVDVGYDRIDTVISHIISPYPISTSRMTRRLYRYTISHLPYRYPISIFHIDIGSYLLTLVGPPRWCSPRHPTHYEPSVQDVRWTKRCGPTPRSPARGSQHGGARKPSASLYTRKRLSLETSVDGGRANAWCLRIHAEASLTLSLSETSVVE